MNGGILRELCYKPMKRTIVGIFILGFILSILYHAAIIPNTNNPLSPKLSLRDVLLVKYYSYKSEKCLTKKDGRELFKCVNLIMREVSGRYGARIALDIIEPVSQKHPTLQGWGHDLSHTIGDNALYAGTGLHSGRAIKDEAVLIAQIGKTIVDCDGWGSLVVITEL